jgi:hypothetical protein
MTLPKKIGALVIFMLMVMSIIPATYAVTAPEVEDEVLVATIQGDDVDPTTVDDDTDSVPEREYRERDVSPGGSSDRAREGKPYMPHYVALREQRAELYARKTEIRDELTELRERPHDFERDDGLSAKGLRVITYALSVAERLDHKLENMIQRLEQSTHIDDRSGALETLQQARDNLAGIITDFEEIVADEKVTAEEWEIARHHFKELRKMITSLKKWNHVFLKVKIDNYNSIHRRILQNLVPRAYESLRNKGLTEDEIEKRIERIKLHAAKIQDAADDEPINSLDTDKAPKRKQPSRYTISAEKMGQRSALAAPYVQGSSDVASDALDDIKLELTSK